MSNKKRSYYVKERHYIQVSQETDIDGNTIIGVYHNKNTPLPKTIDCNGKKAIYKSLGHKISLTRRELIGKKYWRDVLFTNPNELADIQREIRMASPQARKNILLDKAERLGLPRSDEIIDKYLEGTTAGG